MNVRLVWLAGQNRWQELAESAGDYLKQHPDNLAVAETAGNLLLNCPKPENRKASLVFFQHLASRRSDSAEAQAVLGMCHFQLGQIQDARSLLERAHGMNPKNLGILNNLAWILCEDLREPKSAERLMAKYILGGADEASLWDTWGVVLYRLGRVVEAEKALDRAMNHPRASRETQHSAAFHLARAIAESDQQRSRTLLDNLLSKGDDMLKLSPSEKMEAEQLREKLSG